MVCKGMIQQTVETYRPNASLHICGEISSLKERYENAFGQLSAELQPGEVEDLIRLFTSAKDSKEELAWLLNPVEIAALINSSKSFLCQFIGLESQPVLRICQGEHPCFTLSCSNRDLLEEIKERIEHLFHPSFSFAAFG